MKENNYQTDLKISHSANIDGSRIVSLIKDAAKNTKIIVPGFRPGMAPAHMILERMELKRLRKIYLESIAQLLQIEVNNLCKQNSKKLFMSSIEDNDGDSVWEKACSSAATIKDLIDKISLSHIKASLKICFMPEPESLRVIDTSQIEGKIVDEGDDEQMTATISNIMANNEIYLPVKDVIDLKPKDVISFEIKVNSKDGLLIYNEKRDIKSGDNPEQSALEKACVSAPTDRFIQYKVSDRSYIEKILGIKISDKSTVKIKLLGIFRKKQIGDFEEVCSSMNLTKQDLQSSLVAEARARMEKASSIFIRAQIARQMLTKANEMLFMFDGFKPYYELSINWNKAEEPIIKKSDPKTRKDAANADQNPEEKNDIKSTSKQKKGRREISKKEELKDIAIVNKNEKHGRNQIHQTNYAEEDKDISAKRGMAMMYLAEYELQRLHAEITSKDISDSLAIVSKRYNLDPSNISRLLEVYPALRTLVRREAAIKRAILEIEKSSVDIKKTKTNAKDLEQDLMALLEIIRPIEWSVY